MDKGTVQEIERALQPIIEKLGDGAAFTYESYVRQAFITGLIDLLILSLVIVVSIVITVVYVKFIGRKIAPIRVSIANAEAAEEQERKLQEEARAAQKEAYRLEELEIAKLPPTERERLQARNARKQADELYREYLHQTLSSRNGGSDDLEVTYLQAWQIGVPAVLWVVVGIAALCVVPDALKHMMNPHYFAIRDLLASVRGQ